jgi:hypothetical protein
MKRKVLSLVAFMAFSVIAFANTNEIKEEVVVEEIVVVDCFEEALAAENQFIGMFGNSITGNGFTISSYDIFANAYDYCTETYECSSCLQGN